MGLLMVSLGHLDAMLESELTGARLCSSLGLTNLRKLPEYPFAVAPQSFFVARNNQMLLAILDKRLEPL